jgi:hypothetical protein
LNKTLSTFVQLGEKLVHHTDPNTSGAAFDALLTKVHHSNGWFDPEQVRKAVSSWSQALSEANIRQWLANTSFANTTPRTIGLIVAGNIPLVGMHDLLCLWASPHKTLIKCARKDPYLLPWIVEELESISPNDKGRIAFTQGPLKNYEAVIATGSNNSARYFESYFQAVPHLIRKNRNAIAVLDGSESKTQLEALGEDILRYYGLGCRNVSKVYLPKGYDLDLLFGALYPYREVINGQKYANNYDYNKAVYLMSDFDFLENGFFLVRESDEWAAPIACLHYSFYEDLKSVQKEIIKNEDKIQCVVSELPLEKAFPLGQAQEPQLWDYADGVNTLSFLSNLP